MDSLKRTQTKPIYCLFIRVYSWLISKQAKPISGQPEKFLARGGYCLREIGQTHPLQFSQSLCGMNHKGRLIYLLLPHRLRRHIRTIRLDHQSVQRNNLSSPSCGFGILESNYTGERNVKTPIENNLRLRSLAAEAMK